MSSEVGIVVFDQCATANFCCLMYVHMFRVTMCHGRKSSWNGSVQNTTSFSVCASQNGFTSILVMLVSGYRFVGCTDNFDPEVYSYWKCSHGKVTARKRSWRFVTYAVKVRNCRTWNYQCLIEYLTGVCVNCVRAQYIWRIFTETAIKKIVEYMCCEGATKSLCYERSYLIYSFSDLEV